MAVHKRANARRHRIDRDFPHQVALPADFCCMENYTAIDAFCRRFDPRPESSFVYAATPDGRQVHFRLHCFATRADAEVFADHFHGEHFDPIKDRGRGKQRNIWRRDSPPILADRYGPLSLPKFFLEHP